MDDDLKRIELQAAKIRLERDQLLLENERDRRRRVERVTEVAQGAFDATKQVGGVVASAAGTLIGFVITTLITLVVSGLFGLLVSTAWVAISPRKTPGDFQYQLGFFLGGGGWVVIVGCCGLGLWALWFGDKAKT